MLHKHIAVIVVQYWGGWGDYGLEGDGDGIDDGDERVYMFIVR